jgi:hypothetical protein
MSEYRWLKFDLPLTSITDDSAVAISDKERVLLANRLQQTIRLNNKYWPKLSTFQKAGLVVHEMVSAAFLLHCDGRICSQSSHQIREAVGNVFAPDRGLSGTLRKLLPKLNVPDPSSLNLCPTAGEGILIVWGDSSRTRFSKHDAGEAAQKICETRSRPITKVIFERKQLKPIFRTYVTRAADGSTYDQEYLSIDEFAPTRTFNSFIVNDWRSAASSQACVMKITSKAADWFSYDPTSNPTIFTCTEM